MRIALALVFIVALLGLLGLGACSASSGPGTPATAPVSASPRTPAVPAGSPNHDLFEGVSYKNACTADADCQIGGCGGEVCSAEEGVITPCIAHADKPQASCGCVQGDCIWYTTSK
jgi:eight-cysteine-cluster-containing protein